MSPTCDGRMSTPNHIARARGRNPFVGKPLWGRHADCVKVVGRGRLWLVRQDNLTEVRERDRVECRLEFAAFHRIAAAPAVPPPAELIDVRRLRHPAARYLTDRPAR